VARVHRTQIGIVGAGPAGLMLGHLLHRHGIESVVLELRSRDYVEHRIRAGVLEHGTAKLLEEAEVGDRMRREGMVHHGIELRFDRRGHRIDFAALADGCGIMVYGQTEVVKDLIRARLDAGAPLTFDVADVRLHDLDTERPAISYTHDGVAHELHCDAIAGCDGFHGVCRFAIPIGALEEHQRDYPFGWLGILAEVAPSTEELIYARHERGFALHSMRTPTLSRFYLQCDPNDDAGSWSDDRIWEELHLRLACDGWQLEEGPIVDRSITPMRSYVVEPLQYGRLFLAGDAAHIVPPTGAKGLNLAMGDVSVLADALCDWYESGDRSGLEAYSDRCLRRVWRAEHFSWWMTSMLHRFPGRDAGFEERLQRAQLEYVCGSQAAATTLAENYVGLASERAASAASSGLAT
jgi:p-hydroxybenzoate 3-monooxygenase